MDEKKARLQALIEGIIYKLAPITNVYNVYLDENTTLAKKLSEIITSLNGKAKSDDVGDVSELITEAKDSTVSAINEVAQKFGSTGGSAPQPDMEAAEGEPGHILNRTHWRDVTETVLFEQTITVANNQFLDASGVSIPLNAGETYTVVWDGVSYKTVAKDMVYNGFNAVAVGNGAFTGAENTGEPFLILTLEGAGYGVACLTDGEHTFTVSGNKYTYHPIPPEYLAGSKPFYIDLKSDENRDILYETDVSEIDVRNALVSGYQIVVRRALRQWYYYDFFFMDRSANDGTLYFYRITDNDHEFESLKFTPNGAGGYDITHQRVELVQKSDLPTALKNPYALTINGTSYDGSQAVDLTEAVNNMIVAKLNALTHAEEVAF